MLNLPLPLQHFGLHQARGHVRKRKVSMVWRRWCGEHLGADPLSGHLFVFRNKRGDRVKLLYWNEDGYAIWYKRLEEGIFAFPDTADSRGLSVGEHGLQMRAADLAMLLDGVDLASVKRGKRFERRAVQPG